jgi:hypothetical protein
VDKRNHFFRPLLEASSVGALNNVGFVFFHFAFLVLKGYPLDYFNNLLRPVFRLAVFKRKRI